jgi:hypothetical protein
MEETAVRWNIKVSKKTDLTLRTFLGSKGMKKGDLSKFIEEAVRWRVFHRTVQDFKTRNADTDPDKLQGLIDDAVSEVRTTRYANQVADKPYARGARHQYSRFLPSDSNWQSSRDLPPGAPAPSGKFRFRNVCRHLRCEKSVPVTPCPDWRQAGQLFGNNLGSLSFRKR